MLASIQNSALLEFGCMGYMNYSRVSLERVGVSNTYELYSTHIGETDIALNGVRRSSSAVADITQRDKPGFLFLLPSAVPEIIGTDLSALRRELQPDHPDMRLLPFGCGGLDVNQHQGIREAFTPFSRMLPVDVEKTVRSSFNIIGSCTDLFRFQTDAAEIVHIVEGAFGMKPLCVMTSDTSAA